MLHKLDFSRSLWELKARHALLGEPLGAGEQVELLSLLQLVTGDLDVPAAGPAPDREMPCRFRSSEMGPSWAPSFAT